MSAARSQANWLRATGQTWRAWTATLLYPSPVVSFVLLFLDSDRAPFWCASTIVLFGVSSLLAISVRCRVCDEWVFLWSWKPPQNPAMLFRIEACPNCGARSDRDKLW